MKLYIFLDIKFEGISEVSGNGRLDTFQCNNAARLEYEIGKERSSNH